jgi:hypothetical protein
VTSDVVGNTGAVANSELAKVAPGAVIQVQARCAIERPLSDSEEAVTWSSCSRLA